VITVGYLHTGDAFNVIPCQAIIRGTIRTFDLDVRLAIIRRFEEVVQGVGEAFGCTVEIDLQPLTPAVANDPQITAKVLRVAAELFPGSTIDTNLRTMVSEDMAFLMQEVPGCYLLVGSANPSKGLNAPHHHPRFDFDEGALPRAAALMAAAIFGQSL